MWKMRRFTRRVQLLLLLLVTLCAASEEEEPVIVFYQSRTFTVSRGSSVKLSCQTKYDMKLCGLVHAVWHQKGTELIDPDRYLTTVNETVADGNMRLRQVVTEILKVGTEDSGEFQCKAACETGESAMGHLIQINVRG